MALAAKRLSSLLSMSDHFVGKDLDTIDDDADDDCDFTDVDVAKEMDAWNAAAKAACR